MNLRVVLVALLRVCNTYALHLHIAEPTGPRRNTTTLTDFLNTKQTTRQGEDNEAFKPSQEEDTRTPKVLPNANFTIDRRYNGPFCANHWPNQNFGDPQCCESCVEPKGNTPHFLYSHTEKTGGSSLECAWQQASRQGTITLLGHSDSTIYEACASLCARNNVATRRLITVRDPYMYWQSMYKYAWECIFHPIDSSESLFLLADSTNSGVRPDHRTPVLEQLGVLRSFADYLRYMSSSRSAEEKCLRQRFPDVNGAPCRMSQQDRIHSKCGDPCRLDDFEVLHTENLTEEYAALLAKYPGLPQVALPRLNEANDFDKHPWGEPPPARYTRELMQIVQNMDGWIFDTFNYERERPGETFSALQSTSKGSS